MALNAALATAGQALGIYTSGIQVANNNISNANTPGYIREDLFLSANSPSLKGGLLVGTGVSADRIRQQIDIFLEAQLHRANSDALESQSRLDAYQHLESTLNELGESDLSTRMTDFIATIQEVVNQPESSSFRELVINEGERLVTDIANLRDNLDNYRITQSNQVTELVAEANRLIDQIAELNLSISKLEAAGGLKSDAGPLRSKRYEALNRLTEIIPVEFREDQNRSLNLYIGSEYLLIGGEKRYLETSLKVDRGLDATDVRIAGIEKNVSLQGGEIKGVIEGRDQVVGGFIDQLDSYASQIIFSFNKIHASGEGLKAFETIRAETQIFDHATALNQLGLPFAPSHGSFQIKVTNQATDLTVTADINIDLDGIGNDTSLEDLRASLDALNGINATISPNGRLTLEADSGHDFRFGNDTSNVLSSLGINTFFTGHDSKTIGMNDVIRNDSAFLATARGAGPSDNSNAVALAEFTDLARAELGGNTLEDFYLSLISNLAQSTATESTLADGHTSFRSSLQSQREQMTGVSLDEETLKILEFQQAYQASARIISTIDELFNTLINI